MPNNELLLKMIARCESGKLPHNLLSSSRSSLVTHICPNATIKMPSKLCAACEHVCIPEIKTKQMNEQEAKCVRVSIFVHTTAANVVENGTAQLAE